MHAKPKDMKWIRFFSNPKKHLDTYLFSSLGLIYIALEKFFKLSVKHPLAIKTMLLISSLSGQALTKFHQE